MITRRTGHPCVVARVRVDMVFPVAVAAQPNPWGCHGVAGIEQVHRHQCGKRIPRAARLVRAMLVVDDGRLHQPTHELTTRGRRDCESAHQAVGLCGYIQL